MQRIVNSVSVCLPACLSVCLSAHLSQKQTIQTLQNLLYMLSVAVAQTSPDDSAICYAILVLC